MRATDAVEEFRHPVAGPVKLLRFPVDLSTGRAGMRRQPPMAGEHTDEILSEHGYGEAEIKRLRETGAV